MSGTKRGKGSDKGGTTTPRTLRRLKRAGDKSNGTLCRVHRHVFISQCLRVRRVHYMPYVIACCVAHARCVRVKSTHVLVSVGVLRRACALRACEEHPSARLRRRVASRMRAACVRRAPICSSPSSCVGTPVCARRSYDVRTHDTAPLTTDCRYAFRQRPSCRCFATVRLNARSVAANFHIGDRRRHALRRGQEA